jgi:hypothetical protein
MQFYYFIDGERKGPIEMPQLKMLAALGKLQKNDEIELEDGRRIQAREINGLPFEEKKAEKSADDGVRCVVPPPILPTMEDRARGAASGKEPGSSGDVSRSESQATAFLAKLDASLVLFATSAVFLAAAILAAGVGCAQAVKGGRAVKAIEAAGAPDAETLEIMNDARNSSLKILEDVKLEKTGLGGMRGTEVEFLAYDSLKKWQKAALADARLRPSASAATYMDALDRLDFSDHEFVDGDAYNYEVNASLFAGLATLGVGADVRDVRSETRAASAVIAAGAGFVCAALFASTSALLFGLGLLTRRRQTA